MSMPLTELFLDDQAFPYELLSGSKSVLLWKFLLDSLADPDNVPHILKWENKESGIFKFVDTGAVAKMWGQQKRKQDMNFEKLSRGIRYVLLRGGHSI